MVLEKVIILTPIFLPHDVTAVKRPLSWAKYLHKFGYYPIVFCRNLLNDSQYSIEKSDFFEVHYINYNDHFAHTKRITVKERPIRRIFGLIDYVFENSIDYNGIKSIEKFVSKYISENQVKKMVATAPDYAVFGLAHRLCAKTNIKWIADYRDDWTSTDLYTTPIFKLKNGIDHWREKNYLRNCSYFTTVSDYYINKIGNFIGKEGFLVENGFEPDENVNHSKQENTKLTILYPGTLYQTQKLNIVGEALDLLPPNIIEKIVFTFLGTETTNLALPVNIKKHIGKSVFFLKRADRKVANQFLHDTDLLLFLTHETTKIVKGIPSSKLYDFIRLKKAVLVCPSDHDIVEEKFKSTRQGIFCNSPRELAMNIGKLITTKEEMGFIPLIDIPEEIYFSNTREYQTEKLARVLDKL